MTRSLVRWDPTSELMSLRDSMDRLVGRLWGEGRGWPWPRPEMIFGREALALDMYETDDAIVIEAAVPGVQPEEIDVQVSGSTLTIKAERKEEKREEQASYIYQERRFGSFSRSVTLPTEVNADQATAEFEHGVLMLTLPKSETAKPRSIKIKTK